MKVVVFGASGRVGRLFVAGALKRGHKVTCFTRNANNIRVKHKLLRISGGNVSDDFAVREALKGQECVVVALGAKDISKPHSVHADGIKRIVAAMDLHKIKRIVMLGNIGLMPHPSGKLQGEVQLPPFLQFVFADQRNAYETLRETDLDWVIVCPPFMPQGLSRGKHRVVVEAPLDKAQSISVEDAAEFLLKEVFDEPHHQVRVGIAY